MFQLLRILVPYNHPMPYAQEFICLLSIKLTRNTSNVQDTPFELRAFQAVLFASY